MTDTTELLKQIIEARDVQIAELKNQLQQREAQIASLQQQLAELEKRLAELERANQRQAAPFARKKHHAKPKRPGRKAGQGKFTFRAKPTAEQVQHTKEQPLAACPQCGGALNERKRHEQFVIDIPEVQPTVTRYLTHSGHCPCCQQRVRSRHPEQISAATGSAGVVIGPRAKALAADLKHRLGVPYAKIRELFHVAFQLEVSRSGLCQADSHLAAQAQPIYEELLELIRHSAVVHNDETGWRIGLVSAWLWVFTNRQLTVYTIHQSRSHEVVVAILGREFAGILVSDCFTAYDHQALSLWLKQKCVGHLLKDLSAMRQSKTGGAVRLAQDLTTVLRTALALRDLKTSLSPAEFAGRAQQLEHQLDTLIDVRRRLTDPDNVRFAKRLRKQRPHLLRFLYVDGLDATNNQAERMLRPAVISRKTSGCNRTAGGALTHAILASILVTCRQQALPILDSLVNIQRAVPPLQPLLALAPLDTS
jgi:hypothetical protein